MEFTLEGPGRPPHRGGKPKSLVVLLHGLGADGKDLISLAPYWAPLLPETEFISPNAPFPCDMAPYGYQWFSFQQRTPETVLAGVRAAAAFLDGFLDQVLAARGLDESRLALVGFSQGTMMSLHVGLRRAKALAGIVGYSGRLVGPDVLAQELRSKPPVLLMHGTADEMVPFESLALAEEGLTALGVPVTTVRRPGLGHSIDEVELAKGGEFLKNALDAAAR
ncbi:MAG TPA: dienelactone hydrolase family protein [Stellaceae bacterium]|nr:dienelactone hydrolase family protein [Stellaceae bacterium]